MVTSILRRDTKHCWRFFMATNNGEDELQNMIDIIIMLDFSLVRRTLKTRKQLTDKIDDLHTRNTK